MPESNPETRFSFSLDILSDESTGCGEQISLLTGLSCSQTAYLLEEPVWVTEMGKHIQKLIWELIPDEPTTDSGPSLQTRPGPVTACPS